MQWWGERGQPVEVAHSEEGTNGRAKGAITMLWAEDSRCEVLMLILILMSMCGAVLGTCGGAGYGSISMMDGVVMAYGQQGAAEFAEPRVIHNLSS